MKRMKTSKLNLILAASLGLAMPALLLAQDPLSKKQLEEMNQQALEQAAREEAAKKESPANPAAPQPARPASSDQAPIIPLTEPPQDLIGEDGKVELDLVDPFQRSSENVASEQEGLSATSLGEISDEFRILAILIAEDETHQPMALIRLQEEDHPQVVKKDDLVQIKRRPSDRRSRPRSTDPPSIEDSALTALESYSFYLQIKEIHPTYIEAFQKKSPNESIILR